MSHLIHTSRMSRGWCWLWVATIIGCGSTAPPVTDVVQAPAPQEREFPMDPARRSFTERLGFPEYIIGVGDVLELTLRDLNLTREEVTVRPDGNVSFSLLENVSAGGRTPTELDEALTTALAQFLRSPKIDVRVTEYNSKMVSLLGAISVTERSSSQMGQGRYPLKGKTTLLDLILIAGGATPDAQLDNVTLVRDGSSYKIDLQKVLRTGDPRENAVLQGGDIVIVQGASLRSKKVIVLGEVANPSVYMFPEDARVIEALSQAGGLTDDAVRNDIRLIRVEDGEPRMYGINFERLATRGDYRQNVPLRNDDIIFVPRSFLGDVNDVITRIEPLLTVLLLPASYRDLYTTGGGLRVDTGESDSGIDFTRTLPGTAKPAGNGDDENE
ncbi:MAG: polysaccharide biosynthesis/export family protein [Candidatus Latescibacterota bacterium]|nr:polysaccharide biosynthesis/export family protein [Candidatus Latescibacterota bacterium]